MSHKIIRPFMVLLLVTGLVVVVQAPQSARAAGPILQVSAGRYHACALKSDGSVVCWGRNDMGQSSPPTETFIQISAGDYHTCGLKSDSSVACWGWNVFGQSSPPAGTFTQINAGSIFNCGLKSDSSVACWGYNSDGQSNPPAGTFTQVSAGNSHTCGIKSDDSVACWGSNSYGQSTPPVETFNQISAGSFHTCGIKSDDSVICWGLNNLGQSAPPVGTFTQISAGVFFSCGVKEDSSVACWGNNYYGQSTPPAGAFTQVSAAYHYSCGLESNGNVVCWGRNQYGQSTPPVFPIEADIDIKPGSDTNPINTKSKGKIPVAILSTIDFDAPSMVDTTSLTFGKTGDETSLAFCDGGTEDVNEDGLPDLVCHFYMQSTGFQFGDTMGILKGQTVEGVPLEGNGSINIVNASDEEFYVCPFEPVLFTLTSPDPVKIPVQITTSGQDLNFGATDPPGVYWALTYLDGTIIINGGVDDGHHFSSFWSSVPGYYYVVFDHPEAGTTYPTIQINLACDYDAPQP